MLNEVRTDHMRCHTSGRDRNERARSSPRPGPPRKPAGKSPRARLPGRVRVVPYAYLMRALRPWQRGKARNRHRLLAS